VNILIFTCIYRKCAPQLHAWDTVKDQHSELSVSP